MSHPRRTMAALLFSVCLLLPAVAQAFTFNVSGFGARLGITNPEDLDTAILVGVHAEMMEQGSSFRLLPGLIYWNGEGDSNGFGGNFDLAYDLGGRGSSMPYVGAGVALSHTDLGEDASTDLGANLFGGLRIAGPGATYFVEGRYVAAQVSQVQLAAGATFGIGR